MGLGGCKTYKSTRWRRFLILKVHFRSVKVTESKILRFIPIWFVLCIKFDVEHPVSTRPCAKFIKTGFKLKHVSVYTIFETLNTMILTPPRSGRLQLCRTDLSTQVFVTRDLAFNDGTYPDDTLDDRVSLFEHKPFLEGKSRSWRVPTLF
jgi:hypothetical protein